MKIELSSDRGYRIEIPDPFEVGGEQSDEISIYHNVKGEIISGSIYRSEGIKNGIYNNLPVSFYDGKLSKTFHFPIGKEETERLIKYLLPNWFDFANKTVRPHKECSEGDGYNSEIYFCHGHDEGS